MYESCMRAFCLMPSIRDRNVKKTKNQNKSFG